MRKIVENYNNIVTLIKYSTIDNELNIPQLNKENIKEIFKITPDCQIERNKTNYILGSIESIKELKTTSSKQLNQLSIIEDELKNLLKYLENPHKRATILLEDKFEISHCSNLVVPIKNYSDRNISFVGRREAKPKEIYTIDTNNTIDKDDAFSLEDEKDYLKLTGYITNVPKILNLECQPIINRAYRRGLSFYHKRHLLSTLFPEELTQNVLSLNADGIYHPVTSYSFILDKATKKIELENIKNELIKIDKNLKIKDIPQLINNGDKKIIDMSTNILEANRILRKEEKQENSIEVECNNFINSYSTLINETVAKIALCHNLIFIYLENNLYTNKASNTDIAYAKVSCPIREFVCFLNTYFQNCGILEPTMTNKEMYYWIDNIGDIIEYLNEQLILQKTIQKIK